MSAGNGIIEAPHNPLAVALMRAMEPVMIGKPMHALVSAMTASLLAVCRAAARPGHYAPLLRCVAGEVLEQARMAEAEEAAVARRAAGGHLDA